MDKNIYHTIPVNNFIDLALFQLGYEKCLSSHSYGPAVINHYLFHYVISGSGILYADNSKDETKTYRITANQGFMIFPGQKTTYIADEDHPWEYVWLEFDGLRVKEGLTMIGLSADSPVMKARHLYYWGLAKDEMLYMVDHRDQPSLHLIGHLYIFMDNLIRSISSYNSSTSKSLRSFYINEAIAYIEKHYSESISVEDIARECGLNRTYFGKIFKLEIGQAPHVFLTTYRMIKATNLMLTTRLSISEISKSVGYENPLHFSRAFKKYYGISPANWKKEHKTIYN